MFESGNQSATAPSVSMCQRQPSGACVPKPGKILTAFQMTCCQLPFREISPDHLLSMPPGEHAQESLPKSRLHFRCALPSRPLFLNAPQEHVRERACHGHDFSSDLCLPASFGYFYFSDVCLPASFGCLYFSDVCLPASFAHDCFLDVGVPALFAGNIKRDGFFDCFSSCQDVPSQLGCKS